MKGELEGEMRRMTIGRIECGRKNKRRENVNNSTILWEMYEELFMVKMIALGNVNATSWLLRFCDSNFCDVAANFVTFHAYRDSCGRKTGN